MKSMQFQTSNPKVPAESVPLFLFVLKSTLTQYKHNEYLMIEDFHCKVNLSQLQTLLHGTGHTRLNSNKQFLSSAKRTSDLGADICNGNLHI